MIDDLIRTKSQYYTFFSVLCSHTTPTTANIIKNSTETILRKIRLINCLADRTNEMILEIVTQLFSL